MEVLLLCSIVIFAYLQCAIGMIFPGSRFQPTRVFSRMLDEDGFVRPHSSAQRFLLEEGQRRPTMRADARLLSCIPDQIPTLQFPGMCVEDSRLEFMCSERELSASKDCTDGSFCCYFPVSKGNFLIPQNLADNINAIAAISFVKQQQQLQNPVVILAPTQPTQPPPPQETEALTTEPLPAPVLEATSAPQLKAQLNDACSGVNDCSDAGTSCFGGRCNCWSTQGFSPEETWSCNDDRHCQIFFPGHVCRPSTLCRRFQGRLGFCQPLGAIKK